MHLLALLRGQASVPFSSGDVIWLDKVANDFSGPGPVGFASIVCGEAGAWVLQTLELEVLIDLFLVEEDSKVYSAIRDLICRMLKILDEQVDVQAHFGPSLLVLLCQQIGPILR